MCFSFFSFLVLRLSQSCSRHPAHGRRIPALRLRHQRPQPKGLGHQRESNPLQFLFSFLGKNYYVRRTRKRKRKRMKLMFVLLLLHIRKEDFRELAQVSCGSVWKGAGLVKTDNDLLTIKKIKRERKCCRGNWGEKTRRKKKLFWQTFLSHPLWHYVGLRADQMGVGGAGGWKTHRHRRKRRRRRKE